MTSWIHRRGAPQRTPIDPYAVWAQETAWRCYRRPFAGAEPPPDSTMVRILAKAATEAHFKAVLAEPELFELFDLYRMPVDGKPALLHFTANVPVDQLHRLAEARFGLRWELAVPLREDPSIVQGARLSMAGRDKESKAMLADEVLKSQGFQPQAVDGRSAAIGDAIVVIDDGAPFLNSRFLDDKQARTRIAALWDQDRRNTRAWWADPARAGYGRELSAAAIDEMLSQMRAATADSQRDEAHVYRTLDYLIAFMDPRRRAFVATHGAHVLDLAGGRQDPLARMADPTADDKTTIDAAGAARLVFVQLPALTASDSSGSSLAAHLLDAVRYALDVCGESARVVVNISFGSFAGAHDGTSLIEQALDELLQWRGENFAIVLAAGNARQARCHARRTVHKDSALLRFMLMAGDTNDSFVELWCPKLKNRPAALQVRVRTPSGLSSEWTGLHTTSLMQDPVLQRPVAMLQHVEHAAGSDEKTMVLLALAPTAATEGDNGPLAEAGAWEIEVRLDPSAADAGPVSFDAWIERDDPGDAGARPSHHFMRLFADDKFNTLSNLACGRHTVVVGGYRLDDGVVADYSSLPARDGRPRALPMVLAPSEERVTEMGIRAAAVRSTESYRMNGTSVAAPIVARRLFNHLIEKKLQGGSVARKDWPKVLNDLAMDSKSLILMPPPLDEEV